MVSAANPARQARRGGTAAALFGIVLALAHTLANAAVQARVEPPLVDEMESVRLTLRAEGANQTENLDLSALHQDFEVLGTNTSSQFQSINGEVRSWVEYQINLRPKRAGTLEIPAIAVAGQHSRPLQITVRPLAPEVRQAIDRMVFFQVEVTPNPVYVQAQALMTRRLYYASGVQIYSDLPGVPDIPNAVVIPVGDTRSTTEMLPEGRYGVLQQRYAIFPEQSGSLRIPEISVTSSVRLEGSGGTRRSGIRVSTPEMRLEVLPVPASYPAGQPWLPAKQVAIRDLWEPDRLSFALGEPVRRTLTIEVTGNTGSSIPPVALGLPDTHFKQYPEPEQISESAQGMDVAGTRQQAYSIVPVAPGAPRLPELRLTWWDTVNRRVRVATAAAEQARIAGDPGTAPEAASGSNPLAAQAPAPATEALAAPLPARAPSASTSPGYPLWLVALTLFAFTGWAATWFAMRRRGTGAASAPAAPSSERSWQALAAACRQGDTKTMRDAWLGHLGRCWGTAPNRTVAAIRAHDAGRPLLDRLNRRLYAPDASETIDGHEIIEATRAMLKPARAEAPPSLPELYARN